MSTLTARIRTFFPLGRYRMCGVWRARLSNDRERLSDAPKFAFTKFDAAQPIIVTSGVTPEHSLPSAENFASSERRLFSRLSTISLGAASHISGCHAPAPDISRRALRWICFRRWDARGAARKRNGRFEAWVYPLKILRDLHLRFHIDGRVVAGEAVARNVITRPESSTIVYSEGPFQVRETLFVPIHEPGATITFEIEYRAALGN